MQEEGVGGGDALLPSGPGAGRGVRRPASRREAGAQPLDPGGGRNEQ
ncbi:hypothetical protein LUX33_00735 [Actinomadura madurae]|nr:hypothetical protein [Actinomadura madurae]MCP9947126.1 hypothetical protein [Actinomadura madurae]MCP9963886.1 hypothetical protein [Actinomadura madurae]